MSRILQAAVVAALAFPVAASAAAVDYFLKIDGIDGESTDDRHKNEIDVESWSWGVSPSSPSNTGRASSKPCVSPISFAKLIDKATPQLMVNAVSGMLIPKAVLTARKAGEQQQEFLKIELTNVLVSSYQTGGSSGSVPVDQFSLNFAKMTVEYRMQKPDGTLGDPSSASFQGGC
jgi:type VI secretion system secreted protein Hcp